MYGTGVRRETLKPLFDRLLIKDLERDELRASGLFVPADYAEDVYGPVRGVVVAVGPGEDWWESAGVVMPVGVGDHVMFLPGSGFVVEVSEEKLRVIRVGELLGVVE